ncbi:hypothetical protein PFISCL1PPCAC_3050 [Pristionchus fissidentatus]|uniref:G protein-coupled receptor n=1 Tax=Pristionchus fissidentatus TaxID=1538716 RepID=A0AAV5UZZ8_9BILA|nr:hypothetical protein PFISCL1PPCAC_3050 [Pristionchus fissidentatus]
MGIFLTLEDQERIFTTLRITLFFSLFLHAIAAICLVKQTPPNQATIRNYLIYIQFLLVVNDINLGILFEPIPLFPVFAGIFNKFSVKFVIEYLLLQGVTELIIANIGVSIIVCIIFRHQSIMPEGHMFKLDTV